MSFHKDLELILQSKNLQEKFRLFDDLYLVWRYTTVIVLYCLEANGLMMFKNLFLLHYRLH